MGLSDKQLVEKYVGECLAEGFTYVGKSDRKRYSVVKCMACGNVGEYRQDLIRNGQVRCKQCQISKYKTASKDGWEFVNHFCDGRLTFANIKHHCCNDVVKVHVGHFLKGKYDCPNCQITKYKLAAKTDWEFVNHFRDGNNTFVNLRHVCCDALVKVQSGPFLKGAYDCPNCMHTHFNDPSYFYVIQVESIIKLGISNRPDERYTQYGLPDDASIIEHLRIPLESKRDALVVESHAKQLVKEFKLTVDDAKQVFTKEGFNECYSIDALEHLLTI